MTDIKLRINLDASKKPVGPHQVSIKLTAWADQAEHIGGMFRAAFEVEMLRGRRRELRDGSICYRFELDNEKTARFRQGLMAAAFPLIPN